MTLNLEKNIFNSFYNKYSLLYVFEEIELNSRSNLFNVLLFCFLK